MSSVPPIAASENRSGDRPRVRHGRRIVAALAVTQTIGYGVLYYAFSVFLTPMRRDLHAGAPQVATALTLAVLTSALCAPLVGRWVDARGARVLMTAGSVLGTLALLAWSRVENLPQLYGVFVAVGLASAMVLYEPAFAVVIGWFDARRRAGALLAVTIVAGFASSIFLPLSGLLVDRYGWRHAAVVLALLYGAAAVPLHALVLRRRGRSRSEAAASDAESERAAVARAAVRERSFWLLVTAFTAHAAAVATVAVLLISYLIRLGHPPVFAAGIAGLLGVLSVTGRLVTTRLQRRVGIAVVAAVILAVQGVAALLLPVVGRGAVGAVGCVLAFGMGFGVAAVTQPHLLAERYGTTAYATLAGRIAFFSMTARAGAPLGAAALAQIVGYGAVMGVVAAACAAGATALVAYHRASRG
ncbi:MFS transporter [Sphaerisporangium sp. NPDC005288]|uniref:MFS transporter n=1 Tax=Sphaerisporangium sp. NPDC005288 TaxID=3155114 RepID=UPI0033B126AD